MRSNLTGTDGRPDQVAIPLGTHPELDADAGILKVRAPCRRGGALT
jgi:hypothetical protein